MNTQDLLNKQARIEFILDGLQAVLNAAPRGEMGLTLDEAKTPVWRQAKQQHALYFKELQTVNKALNKIRKCIGYENVNGKRTPIYKYKQ